MKVTKIKGTADYFGKDIALFNYVVNNAKKVSTEFGFKEIAIPIFEATEVFARGVGEGTDIVNKEMYTFFDKGEKSLTLRPEGTAGVSRAYVENKLYVEPGLRKLFYVGPMFRCERPQAGRMRQFHQFGVEALGVESPYLDADVIYLGYRILKENGIKNVKLLINTLGSNEGRTKYVQVLKEYFAKHVDEMCEDCKMRLEKNPLRILDCKVDKEADFLKNAPKITDYLSEDDNAYFKKVLSILDNLGVPYTVDDKLVRGLDYYNHTVFEFVYDEVESALNGLAILAGGRYNGLSAKFDGPEMPAVGFATGVDRLMIILNELDVLKSNPAKVDVTVMNIGEENKLYALTLANYLREKGISVEIDYNANNLKPQFKLSERVASDILLILGTDEVENNVVNYKNITTGVEEKVDFKKLNELLNIEGNEYAYKK